MHRRLRTDDDVGRPDRINARVVMLLLAVAGAALRLVSLGRDSLWNNEILSFQRATQSTLGASYDLIRAGTHPPLYSQVVLRPWLELGDSEFMQRLPSAVFGVATVALVYVLGARVFGRNVGLAAALLLLVLPLHVYYSREGRMYALLALLTVLAMLALVEALRTNSWGTWSAYALLSAGSLYTHYYAGLTLVAIAVTTAVWLWVRPRPGVVPRWLTANAGIVVLFAPWLPTFWHQLRNDPLEHLETLSAREILELPSEFFTAFATASTPVKALISAAILCLGVLGVMAAQRSVDGPESPAMPLLLMSGAVVGTLVLAAVVSFVAPVMFIRYFVGILPFVCILLAYGAVQARPRLLGGGAFGVLVVVSVAFTYPVVADSWRPNFREPMAYIAEHEGEDEVILLYARSPDDLALSGFEHYYDSDIPVREQYGVRVDATELDTALADLEHGVSGVWVLQHGLVTEIEGTEAFEVVFAERYATRFFERREVVTLTHLVPHER